MAANRHRRSGRGAHRVRLAVIAVRIVALVVAAVALFATRGVPARKPAAWLTAAPVAHRGDWTTGPERPENSLAAFEAAADRSLAIELDVQLTSDGVVVVLHDEDLARMTGRPGRVADTPYAEVAARHLQGGAETVPALSEALTVVNGRVPVFVEVKSPPQVGPLEEAVARELADYRGPAAVMSFNPYSLRHMASVAPDLPRGQLSGDFEGEDLAWYEVFLLRHLLMNWASKPDFVAMDLDLVPSVTTTVQRGWGRPLLCWTAENPADAALAARHCDGVIGDPGSRS
ncbi:Glycerophosphoryl diester phosphodiesterase [Raineyella antarctica]|uniref:Glycerophosphoryl diester phosphodiesterase n=1 Tax=Raineyella antarctica TaxID=1577474 RepID=A0A1G6HID3_9ACTN|nr:glycerophosphodiester phosphodiesterase family protein [Raineyella antarctica]SDB93695.1 Glycerophosphoryl diester phosphodiesterase [Raineyella antarctica]